MKQIVIVQSFYLLRIVIAGICGILIGWERQNRRKAAGIKTHFIIAITASLMMIVSKYGFNDAVVAAGTSVDVSRVASGILAGVGIMGGGIVITGKQGMTSGITTAAGIWATVGIGMAIGAGMYILGVCSTMILFFSQMLMHKSMRLTKNFWRGQVDFSFAQGEGIEKAVTLMEKEGIDILRIKCEHKGEEEEKLRVFFAVSTRKQREDLAKFFSGIPEVYSYEF